MKKAFVITLVLMSISMAYADPVEPQVLVTLQLTTEASPPSSTSVKWTFDDMGDGPSVSFLINQDESIVTLDDGGYLRSLSYDPASGTQISLVPIQNIDHMIKYIETNVIFYDYGKKLGKIDIITGQDIELIDYPQILVDNKCWHIETANLPPIYPLIYLENISPTIKEIMIIFSKSKWPKIFKFNSIPIKNNKTGTKIPYPKTSSFF